MIFKSERYSDALMEEMRPLWEVHHAETQSKNYGPLNPNLEMYRECADKGLMRFYVVRHRGELCGYQVFVISEHLHSKDWIQAAQDVLYLKPEHRQGLIGYRFIKWCIDQLRNEDIDIVHQTLSARNDFGKLFERLGFEREDITYSKRLEVI